MPLEAINEIYRRKIHKNKEECCGEVTGIALHNIKGEAVLKLKRFDTNTWILNPGTKNEEIVRIVIEEDQYEQEYKINE